MIVVEEEDELVLVTQPDHARFAAELLALWRRDELVDHPRRELLIEAVREHDNGWREADAAPPIDPARGRPWDFRTLPAEPRRELWRRGVERFAAERPYVALLTAEHARRLHRDRTSQPGWAELLAELDERREELLLAAGIGPDELDADYRWLELTDALSLAACCRSERPLRRASLRARWRPGALEIEPFPLAGSTTFGIPYRRIPARRYRGEADLAGDLGAARWRRLELRCRAWPA